MSPWKSTGGGGGFGFSGSLQWGRDVLIVDRSSVNRTLGSMMLVKLACYVFVFGSIAFSFWIILKPSSWK
jgi:hypothetical protein